jgi:membrane protease YdiL (CAAX protease family)
VLSLVLGWLAVRTGGLEAGIALAVLMDLSTGFDEAYFEWLTSDEPWVDLQWQSVALDLTVVVAYAAFVVRLARRRGIAAPVPVPV